MFYIINVSTNEGHFFETNKYSITHKEKMEKMYKVFKEKFPREEGYDILVWDEHGKFVDTEYMDNGDE